MYGEGEMAWSLERDNGRLRPARGEAESAS